MNIFKQIAAKFLCLHDWNRYNVSHTTNQKDQIVKIEHTLICKKCGKIKIISI